MLTLEKVCCLSKDADDGLQNRRIPDDLVADILSRLPAKDVIRFRFVSKSFNALIGSRYFIRKHYNVRNKSTPCIFFSKSVPRLYTLHFNGSEDIKLYDFPLMRFPEDTTVLRFCNGLFLIGNSKNRNKYAILNPSTGERKELPKSLISECISDVLKTEPYISLANHGFCYDSVSDDYKVVSVNIIRSTVRNFNAFEVYSLKANSWRYIEQICPIILYGRNADVFVGGALHWLGFPKGRVCDLIILSFDVNTMESKVMPTPKYSSNINTHLGEFEGCLCLSIRGDDFVDLWLMNDYGVKESWIKLFSTPKTQPRLICPLAYSEIGTKILYTDGQGRILLYDLTTRTTVVKSHSKVSVNEYANNSVENIIRLSDYGRSNSITPHEQEELKIQQKGRFGNMVKDLVCFSQDFI